LFRNKLRGADAVVFHGEDLGNPKTLQELEILKKFRKSRRDAGIQTPIFVYFMKEPPHQVTPHPPVASSIDNIKSSSFMMTILLYEKQTKNTFNVLFVLKILFFVLFQ
jgi:hypothetical protein